ncbi:uridylate kinase [Natranaerovirga pectinivora]|uniref:Uridylate kinase n=1 Tax=Natranaerovirga pectinivora TaxID=682400 RepID=A0A4R3MR63_9FIRM|nr:UMP kinase [Natranaerovirga pectinivora]TCT15068.1 uridylate kinase [Natranaerovirga pectinivora]
MTNKRILLKLSGEALAGEQNTGFSEEIVLEVANQVKKAIDKGIEVGVVIGGGNFWRGRTSQNISRSKADQIGMLATIMNAIYVSEVFSSVGLHTEVLTPFNVGTFTKLFSIERAHKYLSKGKVVFFAGGTGHPFFSTDTAAALRAIEIKADTILLAKNIDGVYDSDPKTNSAAIKFNEISLKEVIEKELKVMDLTAAIMCLENKIPMMVFGLNEKDGIINTLEGKFNGTYITI